VRGIGASTSVKLQKRLADAGLGSRRAMEELIAAGEVTVNGARARVGTRVGDRDQIVVRGEPVALRRTPSTRLPRIVLYHKPEGEIVTRLDPEGRASVFDRAAFLRRGRWLAIGRLDFNTCGLLVFTDSGELANRISHPRFQTRRDYAVRILGTLSPEQMQALRSGVQLDDGMARFEVLEPQGGEGTNRWYRVRVREGRNRLVRRMFEALGLKVSRLMRTAFGPFELPPRLKRGQWMRLEETDVRRALQQVMPEQSSVGNAKRSASAKRPLPRAVQARSGRAEIPRRRPHSSRPR
jgi:23S rRNA pseudouridine2605 synthase